MKNILNKRITFLLVFSMMVIITMFTSCDDDNSDIEATFPVITEVRNYAERPGDSIVSRIEPGQWIVITGENLTDAIGISFNGIPAEFNPGLFTDTYAVLQVPAVIPFPSVPASKLNTIKYVTLQGSITFPFTIVAGPPLIAGVINENPVEGEVVTVSGTNLFLIDEISFGGAIITDYTSTNDGTSISFVMPNATEGGPLTITTASGTSSTTYNVNDVTTNSLCNFDDVNTFAWGTGTSDSSTEFPDNHGYYAVLNNGVLPDGDGTWWNWERSINTNPVQWVPSENLSDPVDSYALKFEINVPGEWIGTSIFVVKDYSWDFLARYEPWKEGNNIFSATTEGEWITATIPLSEFRTDNGKGDRATSLTELLGDSGNGSLLIYTTGSAEEDATGFRGAIDNIRIVKIK